MGHRFKTGIGIVAATVALALVPAVSASASVDKSSSGSNPTSPLCKAYRSTVQSDPRSTAASTNASKAIQAGNWKAAQKALLTVYGFQANDVQKLTSALRSAPRNVQSAMTVLTNYVVKYKSLLQSSSSIKQFSTGSSALSKNTKTTAAAHTLSLYYTSVCGTSGTAG
jgi:hypothetical protein